MKIRNVLLEKILLPAGDVLLGQSFIKSLNLQRKLVLGSEVELKNLQNEKLKFVLHHSVSECTYYRKLGIKIEGSAEEVLKKFPILTKDILKTELNNLKSLTSKNLLKQVSSGSSGIQSVVFWTKEEQSYHRATQILWWEWAGYKLGMPIVQTGITPKRGLIKSIKDALLNTYYFPAFVPNKKEFLKALVWAASQRNVFLGGYASSLFVLSKIARELDSKVKFSGAVSWGDKLFDKFKSSINKTFAVNVHETYGTAEGMMIAAQKDLPYMYIMTPNVYLEILDDEGNEVPDGVLGHVVVTSLVAKGMPLIRYKIGDLAIKLPRNEYPEKRDLNLPLLKQVIGRDTDLVKTRSGKYLVVHTFTGIFEHYVEIEQFCVIQENLDSITIEYIPRDEFKFEILDIIKSQIQGYLKDLSFQIQFKKVSFIHPSPSGKPQIIISKL